MLLHSTLSVFPRKQELDLEQNKHSPPSGENLAYLSRVTSEELDDFGILSGERENGESMRRTQNEWAHPILSLSEEARLEQELTYAYIFD